MILKGSVRGSARELATHLLIGTDNEHAEVHEVRGFASEDLTNALIEAECLAKGTRCTKHLFSLSVNPPTHETVSIETFEEAVDRIETGLGLENCPRAVVFHEKEDRRHCHVVWSRIDSEEMRAVPMPYFKNRLMDLSRDLFLEHEWDVPHGILDRSAKNPLSFDLSEWQQAQRTKQDPRIIKAVLRDCWQGSDSKEAFKGALESYGYYLARGDRRGFVAVDVRGEVYSLSRATGIKTKDLNGKLGAPKDLPSVDQTKALMNARWSEKLQKLSDDLDAKHARQKEPLDQKLDQIKQRQRQERSVLKRHHQARWDKETKARSERLPSGLGGVWSRLTGKYANIRRQNEYQAWEALKRDQAEKEHQIVKHLEERSSLQKTRQRLKQQQQIERAELHREIASQMERKAELCQNLEKEFNSKVEQEPKETRRRRGLYRDNDDLEPEL
ncbi:MAG: relaxase/mobilization nuclease domain-containing protein [Paracoccaceae bacterium]|uniref:relaxase/mobilization nuclease domain-containing protein n=3 Tax=Pseudomonadota TaxID=1224 RepID=UPI003264BBE5